MPLPNCRRMFFFPFFFRRKMRDPARDPTLSRKKQKQNRNIWRKKTKNKKKLPMAGRQGSENTCAKFQGLYNISQKRREHWTCKQFGAVSLNQRIGVPAILAVVDRWRFRLHPRRRFRLRHWSCHRCQGVSGDSYCAAAGETFAAAFVFFFSRRL